MPSNGSRRIIFLIEKIKFVGFSFDNKYFLSVWQVRGYPDMDVLCL